MEQLILFTLEDTEKNIFNTAIFLMTRFNYSEQDIEQLKIDCGGNDSRLRDYHKTVNTVSKYFELA